MKCSNCGTGIAANMKFCGTCGAPIESSAGIPAPTPAQANAKFNGRKGAKALAIALIAVIMIVGGALAAYFIIPALAGSNYQKAETAFLKSLFSQSDEKDKTGYRVSFAADYEAGGYARDYDVNDMSVSGILATFGKTALADLTLSAGGDDLRFVGSYDNDAVTVSYPDITEYVLRYLVKVSDDNESSTLDKEKLKKTAASIMTVYFKLTEEAVEIEKSIELSSGDVTVKCDKYTVEFTYGMAEKLFRAVLDEVRANENLLEFIAAQELIGRMYAYNPSMTPPPLTTADVENYLDGLEEALDGSIGSFRFDDGDRLFRMQVWVKSGEIVARTIDKIYKAGNAKLSYKFLKNAKAASIDAQFSSGDIYYETITGTLKGDFVKEGSAWSGKPKFTIKNEYYGVSYTVKADISEFKVTDKFIEGTIKLESTINEQIMKLTAAFVVSDGKQSVRLSGVVDYTDKAVEYGMARSEGDRRDDLGELTLTYSRDKISGIDMPEYDSSTVISVGDYSRANGDKAEMYADATASEHFNENFPEESILESLWFTFDDLVDDVRWGANYYGENGISANKISQIGVVPRLLMLVFDLLLN